MKRLISKCFIVSAIGAMTWVCNGEIGTGPEASLIATANAVVGRPATPVSYAGVARRTTRRAVAVTTPGYGGVGGPASGVGVLPGAGAGRAGVGVTGGAGVNRGGPVNRVGRR